MEFNNTESAEVTLRMIPERIYIDLIKQGYKEHTGQLNEFLTHPNYPNTHFYAEAYRSNPE